MSVKHTQHIVMQDFAGNFIDRILSPDELLKITTVPSLLGMGVGKCGSPGDVEVIGTLVGDTLFCAIDLTDPGFAVNILDNFDTLIVNDTKVVQISGDFQGHWILFGFVHAPA